MKRKKEIQKEKGITLIALVITIIVLLILAGVSIATIRRTKWNINKCNRSKETIRNRWCKRWSKNGYKWKTNGKIKSRDNRGRI